MGGSLLTDDLQIEGITNQKAISLAGDASSSGGIGMNLTGYAAGGMPSFSITGGNTGADADIFIDPLNSKLKLNNLLTDNSAEQVLGKDANGYSVWVDKTTLQSGDNITISGTGTSLDPYIVSLDVSSNNSHIMLPSGNTATRPITPIPGMIRYNNQTGRPEIYVEDLNNDGTLGDLGWLQF